jgi:hypothetical protein
VDREPFGRQEADENMHEEGDPVMPEYDDFVRDECEGQDAEMPTYDDFQDVELEPDEDEIRPMPEDVALQLDPCPDIDAETKRHVRVAHRNLAHPSRETFVRMLRLGGATAEAIRYAKLWTCPTCVQSKQPSTSRPAQVLETNDFNDVVGVDLLEIQDMDSVCYDVMSIVDLGSRYHVAVLLEDKSSQTVARNFARYWVQWDGAPKEVMHDQWCEFKGRFERLMERLNIETYLTPTDSAWQNGVVERHGGVLKAMHRHIVLQTSAAGNEDMEMTLLEACLAKNQLSRRH